MRDGYKKSSMGDIPINWKISKLGKLTKTFAGGTPKRGVSEYYNGTIPWIKSGEVNNDSIVTSSEFVTELALQESSTKLIKPNSILIAMYGATAGKVGVLKVAACSNQAVLAVNSKVKDLSNNFLYHYLKKCTVELLNLCQGSGQPNLSKGIVDNLKILLPPLPEQQKIAEILSTVDAKIEIIDQQITETQELKKGLMQRLLTKGIGHTEFKESALGAIPVGWEVVKINEISKVIDSLHKTPVFSEEGYPMVRVGDINKPKLNLDNCLKVGKEVYSDFSKNHKPTKGDILMTRVGSFGKTILVNTESNFCIGQNTVVMTNIKESKFLYYTLNSFLIQKQLNLLTSGSSQPSLSLKNIRNLSILFPVKEEQQKIATILGSVDEKLATLSEKKETYQELKKGLMQQLLTGLIRVKV